VALDLRTLGEHTIDDGDQCPDLAARPYLHAYSHLIRKEDAAHIGKSLEAHYHWDWDEEVASMTTAFEATGTTFSNLARLVGRQVSLLSRFPRLIENLADPSRLIAKVLAQDAKSLEETQRHRQSFEHSRSVLRAGYDFFLSTSAALQLIIEEQVTALSPDAALALASSLSNIMYSTLHLDDSTTRPLLAAKRDMNPDLPASYIPKAISLEWKFTVLKSLITSAQMQLRVVGVTTMCADLLALHGKYKEHDASQSPMLLHFADFVIRNKIIEYLVGIASHPEIINESSNILGFLIVTNTYKNSQASTIWQTVTTSQDPRVVEAILKMLQRCLNLQKYQDLVYICKKAKSLPIGTFTMPMREFCDELFKMLLDKAAYEGVQQIDAAPYELCVWLIRESSKVTTESPAGYPDIQNFAAARFRDLLGRGLSDRTREEIYLDCTMDVSSGAATAPGSICVINGLLRQNQGADLHTLTTDHGLTTLVVQELESAIAGGDPSLNQLVRNSPASLARRELLLTIIVNEPGTITPELGTKLWDLLVGCESRSVLDRNTSWHILNSAMKKSSLNNAFIATCFRTHLPTLPPDCFTTGALDFTGAALSAWLEEVRQDFVDEDRNFESPALEQLWRLILTAPPNTIDGQAIHMLVEVYVESGLILTLPRARARNIHSTLVDRCLRQLASAAAKLKSFDQESTSSDSDTTMTVVASETEFQEQELIFARSLAVLREFLRAYQTKPQFATPKFRSSLSGASNAMDGDPMTVKYQSFDGGKQTEVMSLTLGKLNTAGSLFTSLQKATGFKNFKLYCGGKGLDPGDIEVSKSLEDLNLNGLVLVQRRADEEVPSLAPGAKTSLEVEIMKHFDELWGYLAMHDKVAQEVRFDPPSVL
jgi:ubiquitin carboxyl-terminal hydrolase 34